MADIAKLPYRCPKCFHNKRFPDVGTLRYHLEVGHSYVNMSIPSTPSMSPRPHSANFIPISPKGAFSQHAKELEKQLLLAKGLEGLQYESQGHHSWPHISSPSHQPVLEVLLSPTHSSPRHGAVHDHSVDVLVQEKTDEVQKLKRDLLEKDHDLAETSHKFQEVNLERLKLQGETRDLSHQIESHSMEIRELKSQLKEQHREVKQKEISLSELNQFIEDTAAKQSTARDSLKKYVNDIMKRAESAETEVSMLRQSMTGSWTPETTDSAQEMQSGGSSLENLASKPKAHPSPSSSRDFPPPGQMEQSRFDRVPQPIQYSSPASLPKPVVIANKQPTSQSTNQTPTFSPRNVQLLEQQQQQLQQQLDDLQHQQVQLQQSLLLISQQPTQVDLNQDYPSPSITSQSTPKRNPTLKDASHGSRTPSPSMTTQSISRGYPTAQNTSQGRTVQLYEVRKLKSNGQTLPVHRARENQKQSDSRSPARGHHQQGLSSGTIQRKTLDKSHSTSSTPSKPSPRSSPPSKPSPHSSPPSKPSPRSSTPSKPPPRSSPPLAKETQHQQTLSTSPHTGRHHTLPWQHSTLPTNHSTHASLMRSLSATLPPYSGSELPDFPQDIDERADVPLQSTGIDDTDVPSNTNPSRDAFFADPRNISSRHRTNSEIQKWSASYLQSAPPDSYQDPRLQSAPSYSYQDPRLQSALPDSYQDPRLQSALPDSFQDPRLPSGSAYVLSCRYSGTDPMNLEELQDSLQELVNCKQPPRTNGRSPSQSQTSASSLKAGLTSLPSRHSVHMSSYRKDVRAMTLPNGIPKKTLPHDYNTRLTLSNQDLTRSTSAQNGHSAYNSRPSSVGSGSGGTSPSYTTVSELSDSLTDVTYTPSVDTQSGYAMHPDVKIPLPSMPMTRSQKYALICIFSFLDLQTLLNCALVCQDWKELSRHPSLWRTVELINHRMSSTFLQTISKWSTELEWLTLENLRPRGQRPFETKVDYYRDTRGCLEPGLEYLFHKSGSQLISLKIVNCPNILTERSLWLASCYCRNLCSLTYVSHTDPIGHEVIWALGAGCRKIESLKIPPGYPCDQPHKFGNRCVQMIGRCWPMLIALSIGGQDVDGKAIVTIAKNCPRLQVLELDHMSKVTEHVAIAMTQNGMRGVQILIFRHTPVTTKSIMQFNGACSQLRSLSIHLAPSDYFQEEDGDDDQNTARFNLLHKKLQTLALQPALQNVLHLRITSPRT